jgi:hypothetical protein
VGVKSTETDTTSSTSVHGHHTALLFTRKKYQTNQDLTTQPSVGRDPNNTKQVLLPFNLSWNDQSKALDPVAFQLFPASTPQIASRSIGISNKNAEQKQKTQTEPRKLFS